MDPDANLEEQRTLSYRILNEESPDLQRDALRLAELVEALDGWMGKGGFPPKAWKKSES